MTAATTSKNNSITATATSTSLEIENVLISGCPTRFPAIAVDSDRIVATDSTSRTVRYSATSCSVKRTASGELRVSPSQKDYLLQVPSKRPESVGLMLVGLGGNNGSTLTASLLAHKHNISWKTRRGLQNPNFYGSLVMASTIVLGSDESNGGKEITAPIYQVAPFVDPKSLVVGGWDISSMNLADACDRAQVLEPTLIDALKDQLSLIKPLASIYDPNFIASNQSDRADNFISGSKREKLEAIRRDIRYYIYYLLCL